MNAKINDPKQSIQNIYKNHLAEAKNTTEISSCYKADHLERKKEKKPRKFRQ